MSEQNEVPPRAAGSERELTDAEIQDVLRSSRRFARRRKAARQALELAGPTKLKAQSKLWKQAAHVVLENWPRDCDHLEQALWPQFSEYSEAVFDKIAENRSDSLTSKFSLRRYVHWLRCTCIAAVIEEDVCPPGGQFYATVQHVIGVVGEARRLNQIGATKRALYQLLTEFLGGPYTQNLEKRLRSHLDGRAAHWEGEAMERVSLLVKTAPKASQTLPRLDRTQTGSYPAQVLLKSANTPTKRRGPLRDHETAARVAAVVLRVAPSGNWRSLLDEILMALDDEKIKTPKTWEPRHGFRNWYASVATDPASRGRHFAIEAIRHHLKRAAERPAETIP